MIYNYLLVFLAFNLKKTITNFYISNGNKNTNAKLFYLVVWNEMFIFFSSILIQNFYLILSTFKSHLYKKKKS